MAKTVKCTICGKELNAGFFSYDAQKLYITKYDGITCCEDCCKTYVLPNSLETTRFLNKLENYKKANRIRKLEEQELARLYMIYFRERQAHIARNGRGSATAFAGFFCHDNNGRFSVEEVNRSHVMSVCDMEVLMQQQRMGMETTFDAGDISQIRYCMTSKPGTPTENGDNVYVFEVWLNDPAIMTYKPTVTYALASGRALFTRKEKQQAEQTMEVFMEAFRNATGSQLPVQRVKKF